MTLKYSIRAEAMGVWGITPPRSQESKLRSKIGKLVGNVQPNLPRGDFYLLEICRKAVEKLMFQVHFSVFACSLGHFQIEPLSL